MNTLKTLCEDKDIPMFLCGETALSAYRDSSLSDFPSVCIRACDSYKLIKAIDTISSAEYPVAIDSMLTSRSYPNYDLHFCDLKTTDFNAKDCSHYTHNCMHITIKLIENVPIPAAAFALTRKAFRKYKSAIKNYQVPHGVIQSNRLFRIMTAVASAPGYSVRFGGKTYNKHYFDKRQKVYINNNEFYIPGIRDEYLVNEFGIDWRHFKCREYAEAADRFVSARISWNEYSDAIQKIDLKSYTEAYIDEQKIMPLYKKQHAKITDCYKLLERTYDRLYLYQKYIDKKDYLKDLYSKQKYDELRNELSEYLSLIDKHRSRKLGLCFDEEVLEMALKILEMDYGKEYAHEIQSLIPEEHRKPIRIKDYKGNYI